jgi:solute:Na+ symporter, SSS family
MFRLGAFDIFIIVFYFAFVLGVGWFLKRRTRSGLDFFLAGRSQTAFVAGISFIAASMGALELMGWSAATYQYGLLAVHWYWIGVVPAMLFLGVFMMPFYYISRTHSVPGYLHLRYGESTRVFAAFTFVAMTLLASGISLYSMGLVLENFFGWDFNTSIWVTTLAVCVYVSMGGLTSAIFNEIVQFFLIWAGAFLIPVYGLIEVGGWRNLVDRVAARAAEITPAGMPVLDRTHIWSVLSSPEANTMGMQWLGIAFGLCFVLATGYWCTDFLVVQRVLTTRDVRSARMAPVLASIFKVTVPLIVILPGLLGFALIPGLGPEGPGVNASETYNAVLPLMMKRYFGPGLIGLGLTALIAGFMSGMAGNVTAFATVWTYDIYRSLIRPDAPDRHYLSMGRWCTVLGMLASIGTTYLVKRFASMAEYTQALFSFFIAPLFATVVLGMFWKRATPKAGFWGLLLGMLSAVAIFFAVRLGWLDPYYVSFSRHPSDMAVFVWQATWAFLVDVAATVLISLFTRPRPVAELAGLVYGAAEMPRESGVVWYHRPAVWAVISLGFFISLNLIFW